MWRAGYHDSNGLKKVWNNRSRSYAAEKNVKANIEKLQEEFTCPICYDEIKNDDKVYAFHSEKKDMEEHMCHLHCAIEQRIKAPTTPLSCSECGMIEESPTVLGLGIIIKTLRLGTTCRTISATADIKESGKERTEMFKKEFGILKPPFTDKYIKLLVLISRFNFVDIEKVDAQKKRAWLAHLQRIVEFHYSFSPGSISNAYTVLKLVSELEKRAGKADNLFEDILTRASPFVEDIVKHLRSMNNLSKRLTQTKSNNVLRNQSIVNFLEKLEKEKEIGAST